MAVVWISTRASQRAYVGSGTSCQLRVWLASFCTVMAFMGYMVGFFAGGRKGFGDRLRWWYFVGGDAAADRSDRGCPLRSFSPTIPGRLRGLIPLRRYPAATGNSKPLRGHPRSDLR